MKLTRDGAIWWVAIIGGVLGFLGGHFELLQKAFPGVGPAWNARIELFAGIVALIGGFLRMSPLALSADHPVATNEASQTLSITGKPLVGIVLAIALAGAVSSCAKAHHVAVVTDEAVARVVFALDDAEYEACHKTPLVLTPAQCARLDPLVKRALLDVKALTAALQTTQGLEGIPTSLSALVKDVIALRVAIDDLGGGPTFAPIAGHLHQVETELLALLGRFTGATK